MLTTKIKLDKGKVDQAGNCPVFLYAYFNGQRFKHSTGEKCSVKQWDDERERFRRSNASYQEANRSLDLLEERCRQVYREYIDQRIIPTVTQIKNGLSPQVQGKQPKQQPLVPMFAKYCDTLALSDRKNNTVRTYRTTLYRLGEYEAHEQTLFADMYSQAVHDHLLEFCWAELNLHPNSVFNVCKHLRAFFNYCKDTLEIELDPRQARITPRFLEGDRVFLVGTELERLKAVPVSKAMERVRDAFLFACSTGLRYSDWSRLTLQHVQDRVAYKIVTIVPAKTNSSRQNSFQKLEVPLLNGAVEIIEKYKGQVDTLIPVMSQQKLNEALKTLTMMAGIDEMVEVREFKGGKATQVLRPKHTLVSSHTARHTFAIQCMDKGVPLEILQKALGHADLRTTLVYAKISEELKNRVLLEAWSR